MPDAAAAPWKPARPPRETAGDGQDASGPERYGPVIGPANLQEKWQGKVRPAPICQVRGLS
jgi:hypothetical protein